MRRLCSSLVIVTPLLKDLIQQGRKNVTVDNQLRARFLYPNFCLLVEKHWSTSVKIFNRGGSNFTKIYSFLYLIDLETNGKLKKEVINLKVKSVDKCCIIIIINVGSDILGNTLISNSKQRVNHWICFVIDIAKVNNYYKSLG